jgi:hypothetical protein
VHGSAPATGDTDWYALPPLDAGAAVRVTISGDVDDATFSDGETDLPGELDRRTGVLSGDASSGLVPRYLRISAVGDYRLELRADGLTAIPRQRPLPVELELSSDADQVAAFWFEGQRVEGRLSIHDAGDEPLELAIDTLTSHFAWTATPARDRVTVGPGETLDVPVAIVAQPYAWADEPVRISVRVRDGAGAQATAFTLITPRHDAEPVDPVPVWPLPDALLGGLDVASLALGARTLPSIDQAAEDQLHDGLAHAGLGFVAGTDALPVTLTVDLAGDRPVPIAGTILDPLAGDGFPGDVPADFEFLLSTDGVIFDPVLRGRLTTLTRDQAFVLPQPVEATHAQLRIDSVHGGGRDQVALGEWKVVAVPGATPGDAPIDLAQPVRGGHVAWIDPQPPDPTFGGALLDDDPTPQQLYLDVGTTVTWVVGFRDDRAAQLTRLEWVDPIPSTEGKRFESVEVAISMDGPAGPWQDAGAWTLERAVDGSVTPFVFAEPT